MKLSKKFKEKVKSRILAILCVLSFVLCFVAMDKLINITSDESKSYMQIKGAKEIVSDYDAFQTSLTSSSANNQQFNKHVLLHSSFEDTTPKDDVLGEEYTVNENIVTTTANKLNGNQSCYFSGSAGQRLILSRDSLNFGTSDFTVEFWAYAEEQVMPYAVGFSDEGNYSLQFMFTDNEIGANISLVGNAYQRMINTGKKYIANEWVKYRIERKEGIFYVYENDVIIGVSSNYTTMPVNLSTLAIGGNASTSNTAFKGYIDDFTIYDVAISNIEVELNYRNEYIKVGDTLDIDVTKANKVSLYEEDDNVNQSDWTWKSSNEDVGSVDDNGIITGKTVGYTTITGYNAKTGLKARAIIHVYRNKPKAITTPDVQIGDGFTVILKEDGTVWASGLNNCGQLGQGDTKDTKTPVQVKIDENTYLTNVKEISIGKYRYALAVTFDGKVYGWGENSTYSTYGLPAGTNYAYATEMKLKDGTSLTNAISVSGGDAHSMVLTETGAVYVTGHNYWYQNLSTGREGNIGYLVDTGINNAIKISAGYSNCAAMLENGETAVWGHNNSGELENNANPSLKTILGTDITDITLDGDKNLLLKEDGSLYGTGLNTSGQLGLGDNTNRNQLTKITIPTSSKIKYITGSGITSVISTADGKIYVAGYNGYGQASNGTKDASNTFTVMKNQDGTDITNCLILGKGGYTRADSGWLPKNNGYIANDGNVYISGDNTYGQIGNGTNTSSNYLTELGNSEVKLNVRNEYIKIGESIDIDVLEASGFNVFIQDVPVQSDWTWKSSNEDVASVDNNGIVTGKTVGHTTITGYNSKSELKAKAIINVYRNKDGAITVPKVVNGESFTLILKEDGTVWATGSNNVGQLGNGTTTNSNVPLQVKIDENTYLTNVIEISAGPECAYALTKDGYVYAWGSNQYGNLGQGNTANLYYATKMKGENAEGELSNIIQISAGRAEIFALCANGDVYGSGYGAHNEYLDGITSQHNSTIKVNGISNVISINIGVCNPFVILSNGETWAWGHNPYGGLGNGKTENTSSTKYLIGDDVSEISMSGYATIMLKEDGTIWTSGYNNCGQLGLGDTTDRVVFEQTNLSKNGVRGKYVSMQGFTSTILGKDGKIYGAGFNTSGQLSQGTQTNSSEFIPIINSDGAEVIDCLMLSTKGNAHAESAQKNIAIIKNDGTVWLSGDNTYGQIGNGTNTGSMYLTKLGVNEVLLNVRNEYIKIDESKDIDVLQASGFNVFIQDEPNQSDWTWKSSNEDVASIDNNGIVIGKSIGYTTITGYNVKTGMKTKAIINVYRNKEGAITVPQVEEGEGFTVVLKEDGTLWSTGNNGNGQLGDGTTNNQNVLKQVKIDENTYLTNIKKISAGKDYVIAVTMNGEVYVWGHNDYGQLGMGDKNDRNYATKMPGVGGEGYVDEIIDVSANNNSTLLIKRDGTLLATGNGNSYQLGTGNSTAYTSLVNTGKGNLIKVFTGWDEAIAITSSGNTIAWGWNQGGELGTGNSSSVSSQYVMGNDIDWVRTTKTTTIVLKEDGTVWGTGKNNYGQLGTGDTTNTNILTKMELSELGGKRVKYINSANQATQLMTEDGAVWVIGYNNYGQLSQGDKVNISTDFVKMKNFDGSYVTDALLLVNTEFHGNAERTLGIIRNDGTIWLSGDNTYGQIGNGTNTSSNYLIELGTSEVKLNVRNEYIKIDESIDIDVLESSGFNVFIQDAINQSDWTWKSSNEDVASIDNSGRVTGKSIGHTTITGYNTKNGLKAKAIIHVYRNKEGAITVPQVENGEEYTVILKEDGTVWSVGRNNNGQLGTGDTTDRNIPVQVKIDENTYLTNVRKISANAYFAIAMDTNGEVYAWGYNGYAQLGTGDTTNRSYATKLKGVNGEGYLEDVIDCHAGLRNTYCVTKDGNLYVVGDSGCKQIDADTSTRKYIVEMKDAQSVISVYSGDCNVSIMQSNAWTLAKGNDQYGALGSSSTGSKIDKFMLVGTDINDIQLNGYYSTILKEDGSVWTRGHNNYGQLGVGDTSNSNVYKKVVFSNDTEIEVKYIRGGSNNLAILGKDGKVYATGYNGYGQLSNGTTTNSSYLIEMQNSDGTTLQNVFDLNFSKNEWNTTTRNSAVIRQDGTVWVSGDNTYGQIGNVSNTSTKYLTKLGINEALLNVRNEYIRIGESKDIDVLQASGFNVFIQDEPNQDDWTWKSSNEDVASIDNNGIVIGKSIGYTTITGYNAKTGMKTKAIINVYRNKEEAITVPQVEMGEGFTIILKEDGSVWSSGLNTYGQLGYGTTTNRNNPVRVKIDENTYLENVVKVQAFNTDTSMSHGYAMALTKDGEVYAWGVNNYGQLGQGNTDNLLYATKVKGVGGKGYLSDIIDITATAHTAFAVSKKGELYGWGTQCQNDLLGIKNTYYPIKIEQVSNSIKVDSGHCTVGVILQNGETIVWGENSYGENGSGTTSNPTGITYIGNDIVEFDSKGYSSYILKEDGTVWGAGLNNYGQLGLGDTTNKSLYQQLKYENGEKVLAKNIKASNRNLQYRGTDGRVYATGYNGYGQFGNGTTTNSSYPIVIKNQDGTDVDDLLLLIGVNGYWDNGSRNLGIIRQDGTIWLAGDNTYGQIGNATNTSTMYLTKMGDGFLNYPEKLMVIGVNESKNINSKLFSLEDDMNVFTDASTKLGDISYTVEDDTIAEITESGVITGKIQGNTKIKVLDSVTGATTNIWVKVVNDENIKINLGNRFTVALKQDGTLWSWGENHVGQLGLGNTTYYNEPQKITGITEKIVDVKSGYYHSIALTENGEVYTWGYNYYGQLGNGNTQNSVTPIKLSSLGNVTKIDAYKYITIILNDAGEVYVWGNGYGTTPKKLNFSRKVIDIAGNIVLEENRRAYDLNETTSYGRDLIKISAGENHYLALDANGEVYAWGTNNYGQLGNGNNTSSNIPTKVVTPDGTANISDIVEISAGDHYSIISDKDGNVYTFGHNAYNRLAGGDTRNTPLKIENISKTELVAASEGAHTAIVDWDGYVYTAGLNDAGQLGLKDNTQRATFEMVGELQIECEPEKIEMHVGENKDISLSLSSSFNLKSDKQNNGEINKVIINETIASISGNTVTANSIGKTILNASYEGTIGSINTDVKKFYRSIEVEVLPEGGIVVPKVDSGNEFTVSLKADGTVWTWGQNQYGQLGLGDTTNYNEPQKVSIIKETITNQDGTKTEVQDTIKDIVVGDYHVIALAQSGRVYSWGLGNYGQLGVGNGYSYYTPMIVTDIYGTELTDIIKIEANGNSSFAITSKGVAYAWGNGYSSRAQKLDVVKNIIDVTSKYVLSADGKVYSTLTKEELPTVGKIIELDEGTDHTVMLTSEGKAYALGDNTYGQLSIGNNVSSQDTAVAVRKDTDTLFTNIKEIKAGDKYTIIVTRDGKVYTVGINDSNELGIENNQILDRNLPEENTNISNVIFATTGDNHVTVVKNDGTVYAWGNGKLGQLGNRTNKNSILPVMVGDYIIRTNTNRVILGVNSEKIVEGYVDYFNIFNNDVININYTSKDTSVVELIETQNGEVSDGKIGIKLVGKKTGTTVVTANQENSGNIGVIQVEVVPKTSTASEIGITISPNVITNGSHTITLRADGKVYTYGDNSYGQLGNGTTVASDEPIEAIFPEGTIITEIAAGENHNVALDSDGNVWTWGRNTNYQIGHSGGNQYTPYKINGLPKIMRITAGNNNTMVITENNELYAWGLNAYGDLGLGTYTNKVLPTKVEGMADIIDIAGGKSHFIALNRAGEVYVTGSDLYGQLGLGNNQINKVSEFTKVNILDKIGTVNAGDLSNIVTTVDGYVYVWGANTYGNLGTGNKDNLNVPTKLKDIQNIRQVDMGKTHTIIRDGNNNTFICGSNTYGQLGIGTKDSKMTFEQNTKISDVIRASAGNTYTVFLKQDGFVWACGDYNHGSATKKSRTNSKVPVLVGSDSSSLDKSEIVVMKGEVKSIMANAKFKFNLIYIEENDASRFSYSSYKEEIAKVDKDGDILGVREGTTWVKVVDGNTGKEHIAIVRVIDNRTEYTTHVAPNVMSGENFAIGLKEDGTVWTWGYDDTGIAYTNIPASSNVLATYKAIDAGKNFALAIRSDGKVWAIGNNENGQLGIGNLENKSKFVQIEGLTDVLQIATGKDHSLAMDSYGIIYGWGSNSNGQLGSEYIGQQTIEPMVLSIPNERIIQISAGDNQSVFVTANGTVYGMGKILNGYIENISDAVKVDVGDNYILILRADGSIYKYQYGILTKAQNVSNAIDISVQNKVNMYQSVDEKAYTWGANNYGQLGTGSMTATSTPVKPSENSDNVFRVGSGYNNTYIVQNNGYVYSAGTNMYGELGNGTSENEESTTKDGSTVHALVGDRNFEINPTTNTLEINEVEDIDITSNTFNVFGNEVKDLSQYEWTSEDGTVLTVLDDGKVQGINIGTTNVIVTDKITNEQKQGTRAVVPVDTDRIESITANGKDADVTELYKYEVEVPVDDNTTTATVTIKTKLATDNISIDNGNNWTKGIISTTVDITTKSTILPFIVKTEAGNELNYTLTIVRKSNNNALTGITIKKFGSTVEIPATKLNDTTYEAVATMSGTNVVTVTAADENASVRIRGLAKTLAKQSYNLVMTKPIEELPIKVISESGREQNYTLIVYREDYVSTLNKVVVNGNVATKVSDTEYEITINDELNTCDVSAITNLSTAKVGINGDEKKTYEITKNIETLGDVTKVKIQVSDSGETLTKEYTLTINKQRTQSKIQELQVNGQIIKEINNIYKAYVLSDTEQAEIKITAKDTDYYITLGEYQEEAYTITKVETLTDDTTEYNIKIRDGISDEITDYTLIIKRGEVDVSIKSIFAINDNQVKYATQITDTEYEIAVLDNYTDTNLTVNTVNELSQIAIGQSDIDSESYIVNTNTKVIQLIDKETIVPVSVRTQDGGKTKEYTVKIIRVSDDVSLQSVAINELLGDSNIDATISENEENTYEVQLQNPVKDIKVLVATTSSNSKVKIADDNYSVSNTEKEISLDSSLTEVLITVESEYGTEKSYTLKIKTLPDTTDLESIVVDGITTTYNKVLGRYEVKADNNLTEYNIVAKAKDLNASLQIENAIDLDDSGSTVGIVTKKGTINVTVNKSDSETVVPIVITGQNGIAQATYNLAIIEKSTNADLDIVKINGITIDPQADGNYIANITSKTEQVEVYVQSKNEFAKVTVDNETSDSNNVNITRNITENITVYNIKVLAEDGVTSIEKTLTINRLSGNTEISSIQVQAPSGASDAITYTPILQDDGLYYVKVKRQETADVKVSLQDEKSSVTIAGGTTNKQIATESITLLNEITQVNIVIDAEDGTKRTVILNIEKESNNVNLKEIISEQAIKVNKITSDKYEIQVDDRLTNIVISAVTEHDKASIKLGTETEYTLNEIQDKSIDITTETSFTIDVLAEDRVTTKTYTIEVTKKFSTDLQSILIDDNITETPVEMATKNGNQYTGWFNANGEAVIEILPDNPDAIVTVYKDGKTIETVSGDNGKVSFSENIKENTATYRIAVTGPNSESSEFILNIARKSTNNNIEYVKVNGETLTENAETGIYETEVITVDSNKYVLEIKAEDEYATIKLDDGEFTNNNIISQEYTIDPGTIKEINVTVKSQNGEEIVKKVKIYRKDNNLNITSIKINDTEVVGSYDEQHKNYSITLENTVNIANLQITLESQVAKIITNIDGTDYEEVQVLNVENISLPGIGKKVITIKVTSEEGTEDIRTITISQFSSNVELEKVTVNGKEATKRADKNYEITIGDSSTVAVVYAKAIESATRLSINGNAETILDSTANISNIVAGVIIDIPIKAISADGNEYEYRLYITVKSSDNSLEYVKVNGMNAEKLDDTTYRMFVSESTLQSTVDIKATSNVAVVIKDAYTGNEINFVQLLENERTNVEFVIKSESEEEKTYVLEIIKESSDNTIKNVYVNGIEVQKDEQTGRYKMTIEENTENPLVKVTTNNEFAYVRIALSEEGQGEKEKEVELKDTKITTVPITIRSQTGVTNIEYLDIEKIYTSSSVDALVVDDKEVTIYNAETKTYIAIVNPNINPHEMFIMCSNMYATLEINENISVGSITTFVELTEEEYEKEIKLNVTAESGDREVYTIKLVKSSSNVNLSELIINDVPLQPDEVNPDIYTKKIKKTSNKAKVKATTEYPYASVKIGDYNAEVGSSEVWIDLNLLEDVITIPVLVTATDGETIATYNIILTRGSNDTTAVVTYDEIELVKDEAGKYQVSILDTVTSGLIVVTTNNQNAKVDIANTQEYCVNTKEYELTIDTNSVGRAIEVPITVIAEDETVENTTIIITRISTNANTAKVEGTYEITEGETIKPIIKDAKKDEEGIYVLGVKEDTKEVKLKVILENEYANITRGTEVGKGMLETIATLNDKITYVNYTVIAEDGITTKTETIKIVKQSSNASIAKIVVGGEEITISEDGKYHASVEGGSTETQVKITATSDQANIELCGNSSKAYLDTKVTLDNIQNTYTIKVTAEDGTVKEYVLEISKQTNIEGKILTENFEGKHTSQVIVYKTSDNRKENAETDNREVITQVTTKEDGSFIVQVDDIEKYDILVVKDGYLRYRVKCIQVVQGEKITLNEYKLLAGDIVATGEIEIDDLVSLNDNIGVVITDENRESKAIYDLNEDGKVNNLDRNILKANYDKTEETVLWVDPNAQTPYSFKKASSENEKFILPMTCDYVISSDYGYRVHPITGETKFHSGLDIVGTHHTEILAVADGEITYAGVQSGYGNCIEIKHTVDGVTVYSFYAHLSQINVQVGDEVSQGQVIGLEGGAESDPNHGTSTGHHLHFELRSSSGSGHSLNPNDYIKF